MSLPKDCLDIIVDNLINDLSSIYCPYDLLQDVIVLAKTHDCYPILVTETIPKIADMTPSYKKKGVPLQQNEFTSKYRVSSSIIPDDLYILSKSKKTKLIPADVARYFLRKKFPKLQDWIFHKLTQYIGIEITPLTEAIVKHWSTVIKEKEIRPAYHYNTCYYGVYSYRYKFQELTRLQNPNLESAVWIYENFINSFANNIHDVIYHTSSNDEKHEILKKVSGYTDLPVFESYNQDMLHRAHSVVKLCVKSDSLTWKYIQTGKKEDNVKTLALEQFYSNLAQISIDGESITSIKELPLKAVLRSIQTISCFARHNAKITYDFEDINDVKSMMMRNCEINGTTFNTIPQSWIRRSEWRDYSWEEYIFEMYNDRAVEICDILNRYNELCVALKQNSLGIRNDPKSCEYYVMHNDGNIDYILRNMQELPFFTENTEYDYYKDVLDKTEFITRDTSENTETAKLACLASYEDDIELIPLRFHSISQSEKQKAHDQVISAIEHFQKYCAKDAKHTCYSCEGWKSFSDAEYCSSCESSDVEN
jgi:hypothetical protein